MPKHEPEVIAAVQRRRPPLSSHVVLDNDFVPDEQVLCCPRCGYQYLYFGKRYADNNGNLHIAFGCQDCRHAPEFELEMSWHKGTIRVEWKEPPE